MSEKEFKSVEEKVVNNTDSKVVKDYKIISVSIPNNVIEMLDEYETIENRSTSNAIAHILSIYLTDYLNNLK